MSYILSPEQLIAVNAINNTESSDIKYFDLQSAYQTVVQSILNLISQNKKILIHLPESDQKLNAIAHNFSAEGLDELSINIGSKLPIDESDIIKLRTILKKKIDTEPIIEFTKSNIEIEKQIAYIHKYFEALDKKVMSDVSFRDFTNRLIYSHSASDQNGVNDVSNDIQLNFTAQEFYSLKKEIKEASQCYKREFELLDQVLLLDEQVWSLGTEEFNSTIDTITSQYHKATQLNKAYKETYDQLILTTGTKVNQQQLQLEEELNRAESEFIAFNINQQYNNHESDSGFSLFGKKKNQPTNKPYIKAFDNISAIIEQLSPEWYASLDAPQTEAIDYKYISHFIESVRKDQDKFIGSIKNSISNSIQRINRINTESQDIVSLDAQLQELISEINQTGIYSNRFTNNAISFVKQVDFIEETCQYLDQCHILIGSQSLFGAWKQFQNQCSTITASLIKRYRRTDVSQWESKMETWYFNQIKTQTLSNYSISSQHTTELHQSIEKRNMFEVKMLCNTLQNHRVSVSEQLKNTSKEVYNMLFKKKSMPTTSWNNLNLMNKEFLLDFFPIHFSNNLNNVSDYDTVISFSRRPEIMENKSPIHYLSPIDSTDIDNRLGSDDIFLYLNSYSYNQPIAELTSTEKLKASKKLAKYLLSLNQNIKIYQTKSSNIISTLPLYDDAELETRLDKYGLKTIDTAGVLYDRLTESILITDRQPVLIIKDELINPELHKNAIWQIHVQELFKSAGFQILSLNTHNQLEDNAKEFDLMIQKLNPGTTVFDPAEISHPMNATTS